MNAIYYECVNERKKITKKVVEVEPTTSNVNDTETEAETFRYRS